MIIESRREHMPGMLQVAQECGLFAPEQLGVLAETLQRHFDGESEKPELWLSDSGGDSIVAVAYAAEEMMTDRVWNLLFIAVLPQFQNQGRGGQVLKQAETTLLERGCRMLIIETATGEDFEATREFYAKHGYDQEGTVRDFYEDGVGKVVFRKRLYSTRLER